MVGSFSNVRNIGLAACTGDWVLSLDADELPTPEMLSWIRKFLKSPKSSNVVGVLFTRVNTIEGDHTSDEKHLRLFRRGAGKWVGPVHEFVAIDGDVTTASAKACIIHDKTWARQHANDELYLKFYPKLNLGSGGRPLEGWVNYDIDQEHAPNSVHADVFDALPPGLPASRILASHVLEHVSYHRASEVLGMWISHLAPGGTIEIRVPDARAMVEGLVSGRVDYLQFLQAMYGGQTTPYDYHNIAIDESWLRGQLGWFGCVDIQRVPGEKNELRMTARKP